MVEASSLGRIDRLTVLLVLSGPDQGKVGSTEGGASSGGSGLRDRDRARAQDQDGKVGGGPGTRLAVLKAQGLAGIMATID